MEGSPKHGDNEGIGGDLDKSGPLDEDNSAPLATFRSFKVFLEEVAR